MGKCDHCAKYGGCFGYSHCERRELREQVRKLNRRLASYESEPPKEHYEWLLSLRGKDTVKDGV